MMADNQSALGTLLSFQPANVTNFISMKFAQFTL